MDAFVPIERDAFACFGLELKYEVAFSSQKWAMVTFKT